MAVFAQPSTETDLWDLLEQFEKPQPLAGGTDLLAQLNTGNCWPECIVDLKRLPHFAEVDNLHESFRIGAAASLRDIAQAFHHKPEMQALTDVCRLIGSRQIQNRATLGGNICNASPAADSVPLLITMGAHYDLMSRTSVRSIQAEDFAIAPGRTLLNRNELLQSICLPPIPVGTGDAFLRVTPRTEMDIAIASASARVQVDEAGVCIDARIAIGGVAPRPLLVHDAAELLIGTMLDTATLARVASLVRQHADPIDDVRGSRIYRQHVIGVLAGRAAETARDRAVRARKGEGL